MKPENIEALFAVLAHQRIIDGNEFALREVFDLALRAARSEARAYKAVPLKEIERALGAVKTDPELLAAIKAAPPVLTPRPEVATIIPKGWKLVPMTPTKEMKQAGNDTGLFESDYPRYANNAAGSVYEEMLAVAPSCPPQHCSEEKK